jgi:ribonuclease R
MGRRPANAPAPMPSRDAVRAFITNAPGRVGKREISQHFGLTAEHRHDLRELLKSLSTQGDVTHAGHKRFTAPGRLPDAMVVVITGTDNEGDAVARPVEWGGDGKPPLVLMVPEPKGRPALAPGERVMARLRPIGGGKYEGRTLKRLSDTPGRVIGVFHVTERGFRIAPTDKRSKAEWTVPAGEENGAEEGDIVLAMPLPTTAFGLKPARVTERLGKLGEASSVSLLVIATHDIPTVFPEGALAEARAAKATPLQKRDDLRDIPLVTIDGSDARDFDDAVFAEPHENGHRLIVAIADVAHYVTSDSALDRSAWTRGNSCYFPDRVVPMLPEDLSNGWCSLKPKEDRGCLYVEMFVDSEGRKQRHRFGRGLMRSAARLTYEDVQEIHDSGAQTYLPLVPLYDAFRILLDARTKRGTLDLDLPERKVVLGEDGKVASISPRPRLDSHRLIEEFMVLANVCAAEELERLVRPCMYRIHAPPSEEKLDNLRSFLRQFDISLPPGNQIHPRNLDHVLKQVAETEHAQMVNEIVLRSQSQAAYSSENIGHFGLALAKYAHFTSPIRRYADLLVHRALITGLNLGEGGLSPDEITRFPDTAEHITSTERRAALAERDAVDRYLAAFMADKVGRVFAARVSGVTRFGLFVTLIESGASGLVPISSLPDDFYVHDEATQTLSGRRTRLVFHLAQEVEARLSEASPVTGGLIFQVLQGMPGKTRAPQANPRPVIPANRGGGGSRQR